jgi:rubrerythrin
MTHPTIEDLDVDGAIREADARVAGDTRSAFFRKAAVGGGGLLTSGAILGMLPELAAAKPSKKQDLEILNYALTLEYLEAAFYTQAKNLTGEVNAFAQIVAAHERTHVKTLKKVIKSLGGKPVAKPSFDFQGTNEDQAKFVQTAFVLENTGVHAYHGQVPRLKSKALLIAAAEIATVEARHAAAIATILGDKPYTDKSDTSITPDGAFDVPWSMKRVLRAVEGTGFIKGS